MNRAGMNIESLWVFLAVTGILFSSCSHHQETSSQPATRQDTLVGERPAMDELPGSAYRHRATAYFVVSGSDTSGYTVYFEENREDGGVHIVAQYECCEKPIPFARRMRELARILPIAQAEYNFDSLTSISIGRLVTTADMACHVTREYLHQYGEAYTIHPGDYATIASFLGQSSLARQFNELLAPYKIAVRGISLEKVFFETRANMCPAWRPSPGEEIPARVLDGITWLKVGR